MLGNGRNAPIPAIRLMQLQCVKPTRDCRWPPVRGRPPVTRSTLSQPVGRDGRGLENRCRWRPASRTNLRGRHEGAEASLHHLITPFAHCGIADWRWHVETFPYCDAMTLDPLDT